MRWCRVFKYLVVEGLTSQVFFIRWLGHGRHRVHSRVGDVLHVYWNVPLPHSHRLVVRCGHKPMKFDIVQCNVMMKLFKTTLDRTGTFYFHRKMWLCWQHPCACHILERFHWTLCPKWQFFCLPSRQRTSVVCLHPDWTWHSNLLFCLWNGSHTDPFLYPKAWWTWKTRILVLGAKKGAS